MNNLKIETDLKVNLVFNNYPEIVSTKLNYLRELILETANEDKEITEIIETLKWGEPSYLVKKGSTIRIDWKKNKPTQYAMFFKCTSKLISSFKIVYKNKLSFEGNRAIVFSLNDRIPKDVLKKCISTALNYHKVKHLPLLGLK